MMMPHDDPPLYYWARAIGTVFVLCVLSTLSYLVVGSVSTFLFWFFTDIAFSVHEQIRTALFVVWLLTQTLIYLFAVQVFAQSWLGFAAARMSPVARTHLGRAMVIFGWGVYLAISALILSPARPSSGSLLADAFGLHCAALLSANAYSSPLLAFGAIGWFFARYRDSDVVQGSTPYAQKGFVKEAKGWVIVSIILSLFLIVYAANNISFH